MPKTIVGLTGGIASGKSTVSQVLGELGAVVIDADVVGHQCYVPDTPCYNELVAHYGDAIVAEDRSINRPALGGIVFSDPAQLEKLNEIVWPHIRTAIEEMIAKEAEDAVMVVEAAVLLEAGWQTMTSEVWIAAVDKAVARERLMARNSISAEEADKRIASQLSNDERIAQGNPKVIIWNNGSEGDLKDAVTKEWGGLTSRL